MPEEGGRPDPLHRQLKERNEDAWRRFVRDNERLLHGYLARRVGRDDPAALEELFTDVWSQAVRSIDGYGDRGSLEGWLLGIARHLSAAHLRRRSQARARGTVSGVEDLVDEGTPAPADASTDAEELAPILLAVVHADSERSRLFRLRYLEGRTNAEIARCLGTTEKAIEGRLRRARDGARRDALRLYPDVVRAYREGEDAPRRLAGKRGPD